MKGNPSNRSGFTAIEIMLIIAVVVLLGMAAGTDVRRYAFKLQENKTVKILHHLAYSLENFYLDQHPPAYPDNLYALSNRACSLLEHSGIVPGSTRFIKNGYEFIYSPGSGDAGRKGQCYEVYAVPVVSGRSGARCLVMNEGGTVYYDNGITPGCVDKQDTPIL